MSQIVEFCPQTRLHGGLSKLHSADDDAVAWLTSYGFYMHTTTTQTSRPAIAGNPRCSMFKLGLKYNCEKRASNIVLS